MVEFLNECIHCYRLFIDFLFRFTLSGVPVGYILLACILMSLIIHYMLGVIK